MVYGISWSRTVCRVLGVWDPMVRDWQQAPGCMASYGQGLATGFEYMGSHG